ncbi:saccharopine dehydrogenase [Catenuloplanes sp. NPDC051500]|uniref:saccharopine dehydrogenase n=1 Tax=Catenuloplanes sp. NPDC051500 TaxID=3363959 RepID=UPI0037A6CE4D
MTKRVAVLGSTGHTGGFVIAELRRRGLTPIPCTRDTDLDHAFQQADAVINCAGPFVATAAPAIDAAIRAGLPYLDVTAEIEVVTDTLTAYADAPVPIVPAAAFFGGLADLLATATHLPHTEKILIGYALSSWHPTPGTRATGRVSAQRRDGRRIAYTGGRLRLLDGDAPHTEWTFPPPIGTRQVIGEFTMADSATIPTHLDTPEIATFMTTNAVADLRASGAFTDHGQSFLVEVVTRSASGERRAVARGHDIYAITAPLVVEAATRLLAGHGATPGVASLGARFDPADFLTAIGLDCFDSSGSPV